MLAPSRPAARHRYQNRLPCQGSAPAATVDSYLSLTVNVVKTSSAGSSTSRRAHPKPFPGEPAAPQSLGEPSRGRSTGTPRARARKRPNAPLDEPQRRRPEAAAVRREIGTRTRATFSVARPRHGPAPYKTWGPNVARKASNALLRAGEQIRLQLQAIEYETRWSK